MSCPCGLTQQQIEKYNKLDDDLNCTAKWANKNAADESGQRLICGEPLGAHPHALPAPPQLIAQSQSRSKPSDQQDDIVGLVNDIVSIRFTEFRISQPHHGVSTEAEWTKGLRDQQKLKSDETFNQFLLTKQVDWWPHEGSITFPTINAGEAAVCQRFVDGIISALLRKKRHQKMMLRLGLGGYKQDSTTIPDTHIKNDITSSPNHVSYSTRKPDIVVYRANIRGACSITILGDVKGRTSNTDFTNAEVGHILDMARVLLIEHQFTRLFLICFLTDGYRFQFFKCQKTRDETAGYEYLSSGVFSGVVGWQILFGLRALDPHELGLVLDSVPNWILERGLGVGRFSRMYLAQPENDPQNQIVLKYYENGEMGRRELNWLSRLVERENVPKVFASQNLDHHAFALMVTPVGKSVLSAPNNVWITPKMIVTLCGVLCYAHEKEIIHRDVKPDNIFLAGDTNTIFLNDWSSAATCGRECDYHGTPLYGEKKVERHVPTKELDLCSLVKTAFSMMKQISPPPHRHWDDIQAYWGQVSRDFPQFQILLDCARTNPPNYDQLATHFRAMW